MKIVDITSKYGKIFATQRIKNKRVQTIIKDFEWYFYCDPLTPGDLQIVKKYAKKVAKHPGGLFKVYCENSDLNIWDLEKGKLDNKTIILNFLKDQKIKTYEADLSMAKRCLIDRGFEVDYDPLIAYIDIETDDSKNGIEIGRDQILSFAVVINGKAHYYSDKSEEKVLLKIKSLFNYADIFVGWNSTNFDIPYILARFQVHGIEFYKSNLIHWDLMEIFKKRYRFSDQTAITNFNLENICQMFLGRGKIKHSESIKWLFDNAPERLKAYNIEDSMLMNDLDQKMGITELIRGICKESHTPYRNYYISEVVDNFVLQEAKLLGRILPSNLWKLENKTGASEKKKFTGGAVFEPILGIHENVTVLDYNSMYPNVIITFNIGIDTWIEYPSEEEKKTLIRSANDCFFRSDIQSINAIVAHKLLKERQEVKDKMKRISKDDVEYRILNNRSEVIKVLNNSQFGAIGSEFTRFYSIKCSEAITMSAQYILKYSNKLFTQNGKLIISGDTDSVFVKDL